MRENPADLEGWMLLGRSYKSLQRYPEARMALAKARELAPNDPLVAVELAEAMIFTSGPEEIGGPIREILEEAVAAEPQLQKGLWLLGIVAVEAGQDQKAIEYWERLMPLLDPASAVYASVQQQLDMARGRLGSGEAPPRGGGETTGALQVGEGRFRDASREASHDGRRAGARVDRD